MQHQQNPSPGTHSIADLGITDTLEDGTKSADEVTMTTGKRVLYSMNCMTLPAGAAEVLTHLQQHHKDEMR